MKAVARAFDAPMNLSEQIAGAEKNLDRLLQWVSRVDTKVSVVLGIHTGMLGALASLAPELHKWTWYLEITVAVTLALLITGFLFIYFASYPQTKGPSKSLLFFGSISKNSFNEYQQCCSNRTAQEHLGDLLEQCHRNSEVLDKKFRHLKFVYRMMMVTMVPWAATLLLFKWLR